MYCVKCGVRLQDGAGESPLCGTPVPVERMPDETVKATYSDRYPHEKQVGKFLLLGMVTVMMAVAALACFILCMKLKGEVAWSGFVMLGLALAYVIFVLPAWFSRWMPLIFIPVDFAAICGYLLYICLYEHQHWFLSFAFPVTMIVGAFVVTAAALFGSIKGGRFYILGGLCIAFGAEFPEGVVNSRRSKGQISTYYTCCSEKYPNTFLACNPLEATWLPLVALSRDVDGYLRWAFNSWTADPMKDARFRTWAAGDCYMVYPGGLSSVRFERLKEGLQDYLKASILLEEWGRGSGKASALEKALKMFTKEELETKGPERALETLRKAMDR